MKHDDIHEGKGYDVAALETMDGKHVGYVSLIPFPKGKEADVISTGGGGRFFVRQNVSGSHVEGHENFMKPLSYREVFHMPCLGVIRDTASETPYKDARE